MEPHSPAPSAMRNAATLGKATLASRLLGFVRDAIIAALLGGGWMSDAFFVAFRLPNFMRRLLAEGAFAYTLVPAFSRRGDARLQPQTDYGSVRAVIFRLVLLFALLACVGIVGNNLLVSLLAPGFHNAPETAALAARLLAISLPYLPLAAGAAACACLLMASGRFTAPAYSPLVFNVIIIAAAGIAFVLYGAGTPHIPCLLAAGVAAAGAAQWGMMLAPLASQGFSLFRNGESDTKADAFEIAKTLRELPQTAFAASGSQATILVATVIASFLAEGSVSALYFAERLLEFPLGVIGVSFGLASLADFSGTRDEASHRAVLSEKLAQSLRMTLFLAIPAATGSIILAHPIADLLFGRGAFSPTAVTATAFAFSAYAIGLPALAASRSLLAALSAIGDTRAGTLATIAGLVGTILLGTALAFRGIQSGPAIAVSFAGWVSAFILARALRRGGVSLVLSRRWLARCLAACAVMAAVVWPLRMLCASSFLCVFLGMGLGVSAYAAAALTLHMEEARLCLRMLRKDRTK